MGVRTYIWCTQMSHGHVKAPHLVPSMESHMSSTHTHTHTHTQVCVQRASQFILFYESQPLIEEMA